MNYLIIYNNSTVLAAWPFIPGSETAPASGVQYLLTTLADAKLFFDNEGIDYSNFREIVEA